MTIDNPEASRDPKRNGEVIGNKDEAPKDESTIIPGLKPYTQYAIYVETYTVAPQQTGKRIGARSPIFYERTNPYSKKKLKLSKSKHCRIRCLFLAPDPPEGLRAYANSSSELVIEWKPPLNPNGIVTHYIVIGSWQRDDQDWVDKHDSCAERKTIIL